MFDVILQIAGLVIGLWLALCVLCLGFTILAAVPKELYFLAIGAICIWNFSGTKKDPPWQAAANDLPIERELSSYCLDGDENCVAGLAKRVVKIYTQKGTGTGFIMEADENRALILTASHVIRSGHGRNSDISDISVWDGYTNTYVEATKSCAFFKKAFGDIGLIEVPNRWNRKFPKISESFDVYPRDKVIIVDNKHDQKRSWTYTVAGFNNSQSQVILHDVVEPGMSGSPIISKAGELVGIVTSYIDSYGIKRSFGTYKFNFSTLEDLSSLIAYESERSLYVCRNQERLGSL